MTQAQSSSAATAYAARVDAVLTQRTRLRGPQPEGDLFDGIRPDHPLLGSQPREPMTANVAVIAEYVEPETVLVDVGGGAGRISLTLALRCKRVINVEPSGGMAAAFRRNAEANGISNVEVISSDWESAEPPGGTVALVNNVTYLTRDIVGFIEKLEAAGRERVIITVGAEPPPARNRVLYELVHGEPEEIVPSHRELMGVLWEMGRLPDLRVLPGVAAAPVPPMPTLEGAITTAVGAFQSEQWSFWPFSINLEARVREVLERRFDELFEKTEQGYLPGWFVRGREVLITWRPQIDLR